MKRALLLGAALVGAGCAPEASPPPLVVKTTEAQPLAAVPASIPLPEPDAKSEPRRDPNRELAKRVMRALEDEAKIHAAAIDVTASGGVVTLWGTAATPDERQRASRVAYRVIGVTAVENKLAIASGS